MSKSFDQDRAERAISELLAALGEELASLQTAIESLETQWLELTEELGS